MKNTIPALTLALTLTLIACGGSGAGGTPEETFDVFKDALGSEDFETLYDLMQPSKRDATAEAWENGDEAGRSLHEEYARKLGKSADELKDRPFKEVWLEVFRKMMGSIKESNPEMYRERTDATSDAEILAVEYNNDKDRATVKYKAGDREDKVRFYLEDGLWYIRFERR